MFQPGLTLFSWCGQAGRRFKSLRRNPDLAFAPAADHRIATVWNPLPGGARAARW